MLLACGAHFFLPLFNRTQRLNTALLRRHIFDHCRKPRIADFGKFPAEKGAYPRADSRRISLKPPATATCGIRQQCGFSSVLAHSGHLAKLPAPLCGAVHRPGAQSAPGLYPAMKSYLAFSCYTAALRFSGKSAPACRTEGACLGCCDSSVRFAPALDTQPAAQRRDPLSGAQHRLPQALFSHYEARKYDVLFSALSDCNDFDIFAIALIYSRKVLV